MQAFIVLRWRPIDKDLEPPWRARVRALIEFGCETLLDWRGIVVLAKRDRLGFAPVVLPAQRGLVFGALFRRDACGARRIESVGMPEAMSWSESGGERLVAQCWGPYAGLLVDTGYDRLHAVACPSGAMPLHHAQFDGGHAIFADPAFLPVIGFPLDPDPEEISAFLRYPNRVSGVAALKGVERILPGACMTIDRDRATERQIWNPPGPDRSKTDSEENAHAVRRSMIGVCGGLSELKPRVIHRLSGGLDSSVVLAALKEAAPEREIVAVNDHSPGADEGDERAFARLTARHLGVRLVEARIDAADVDYERMLSMPLAASPSPALLTWAKADPSVASVGAEDALVTSGQGGDHIFYRGRGAVAAADVWRDGRNALRFMREAMACARRSRTSVWGLLPEALRMGPLGRPFAMSRHFRREGQSLEEGRLTALEHGRLPWLQDWRRLQPGAAHRACLLLDAQTYFGPSLLAARFAFAPPILFEPVVETMLSIPSYAMTADGRERGLIRHAYAPFLPPEIVHRQTKGQTTRFVAASINRNGAFLADALHGGELERLGLIESAAVLQHLRTSARADGAPPSALSPIICAELWLRNVRRAQLSQRALTHAA